MSSLADYVTRLPAPKDVGFTKEVLPTGVHALDFTKADDEDSSLDALLEEAGYDPAEWVLDGPVAHSRRELASGDLRTSYRFKVRRRRSAVELTTMIEQAKKPREVRTIEKTNPNRALVVVLADLQIGKTGSRGGTQELLDRVYARLDALTELAKKRKCGTAVLLDAGDIIEGIENVGSQVGTNDLSVPDQIDVASTITLDFAKRLIELHPNVKVAGIPSNHCRHAKGKAIINTVNDDWGLHSLRQIKKTLAEKGGNYAKAEFFEPEEYRESLTIDVLGTPVGLVHGHQASPVGFPKWWAEQVHGAGPVAQAEVMITGHYHCFKMQPTGRSQRTGKSKWWLQAPTLDAGSDWYRNLRGDDSDPGLVVFEIDAEEGFDLQSVTVL